VKDQFKPTDSFNLAPDEVRTLAEKLPGYESLEDLSELLFFGKTPEDTRAMRDDLKALIEHPKNSVTTLTQQQLDRYNWLPLSPHKLIFKLLDALATEGLVRPKPQRVAGRIVLTGIDGKPVIKPRKVFILTQEKLDRWNKAPIKHRRLIFKLLEADAKLKPKKQKLLWVDDKIIFSSQNPLSR
jgi:hypothetical protein